jgi:(p)ppGpp synthase/HD superfamily hydrolase
VSRDGSPVPAAHEYAAERHAGQTRRPDGAPFIRHPEEVAALLRDAGAPEPVVAAGLLHDVLEKSDATVEDLEARFGPEVARLVDAVSEDEGIESYERRKAALIESALGAGPDAAAVFAADKASKTRDFRARLVQEDGQDLPEPHKLEHYRQSLAALERAIPDHPLVARLREELDEVEAVRRS